MIVPASPENIDRAASLLREGQLVSFPTETVYGLGADARNREAVARLFAAKRRPVEHPLIVHLAGVGALRRWARTIPSGAQALADAFWPGPLTLVLPRAADVPDTVTGGQDSVGLRVPGHPVAHALLERFEALGGDGVAAPSANRFGRVSATTAQHVAEDFGAELALILDGGACRHGIESTIVAFTRAEPELLRVGAIDVQALARVLGREPGTAGAGAPRAPGTLATHYAPQTPARLLQRDDLLAALARMSRSTGHIAVLAHSVAQPPLFEGTWFDAPAHGAAYAHELYANLRALDARAANEIWIEAPPDGPEWSAVRDRLRRATHRD
ncbi:MAG TPA: L-threonylcarbamoyladenylate synthase [Casimicrobiaceae bacterium]|nr:L-threonylcarbamoyladenylate synthase [Casimicrobiaceae bacterium]